jgi:hypothetical protein|tara:strand:- start:206 stop:352 length:147 start_codon:yes stop_codon:yes gene_type:complete
MTSPIRDILDLINASWMPEEKKSELKNLLIGLVEEMVESTDRGENIWR